MKPPLAGWLFHVGKPGVGWQHCQPPEKPAMSDIPRWDSSVFPASQHVWIVQEVHPKTLISCLIGIFTTRELAIEATRGEPCMFVAPVPLDHMADLGPDVESEWVGSDYPNNVGQDMVPNPMSREEWKARHLEGLA